MNARFLQTAALLLLAVAPVPAAEVRHVVLVSVDGLAATYLDDPKADLPTLRELRRRGAAADGMITTFPSVTWPSHTSLITGTTPRRTACWPIRCTTAAAASPSFTSAIPS